MRAPITDVLKWWYPGKSKLNTFRMNGILIDNNNNTIAVMEINNTAIFFSRITAIIFLVSDKDVRIKNTFPIINDEKAIALTSPWVWPSFIDKK